MSPQLLVERATAWLDQRTTRERALILVVAIVAMFVVREVLLVGPLETRRQEVSAEMEGFDAQIAAFSTQVDSMRARLSVDPDAPLRGRRMQLRERIAGLDERLAELTVGLIPPVEMPKVLRELVRKQPALELLRLESLAAEPLDLTAPELEATSGAPSEPANAERVSEASGSVFKHGVLIELRGTYLGTVSYLESLEALPWRFFWESLDYRVETYPDGRIELRVHSLSTREGWIGV